MDSDFILVNLPEAEVPNLIQRLPAQLETKVTPQCAEGFPIHIEHPNVQILIAEFRGISDN